MNFTVSDHLFNDFHNGVESALGALMEQLAPKVHWFINNLIKSDQDAEELTQDVFLTTWERRDDIESAQALGGFIFTVAKNRSFDYFKKKTPKRVELNDYIKLDDLLPTTHNEYLAKELELWVLLLIKNLPEQQKKVFELNRIEGYTRDEIAKELKISPKTVSNNLTAALKYLRGCIATIIVMIGINLLI